VTGALVVILGVVTGNVGGGVFWTSKINDININVHIYGTRTIRETVRSGHDDDDDVNNDTYNDDDDVDY